MKHIPLRSLPDEQYPDAPDIVYVQVLREVVRRPLDPRAGVGIEEMRQSLKVLDAIDASNGTLELEDADYAHLKSKLDAMQWNVVDRRIIQLIEDVDSA
jgi:hypothetical protein